MQDGFYPAPGISRAVDSQGWVFTCITWGEQWEGVQEYLLEAQPICTFRSYCAKHPHPAGVQPGIYKTQRKPGPLPPSAVQSTGSLAWVEPAYSSGFATALMPFNTISSSSIFLQEGRVHMEGSWAL